MRTLPVLVFTAALVPAPALAHAFGARYDLPLPLWLYLAGAGAAVALSFAALAVFLAPGRAEASARALPLVRLPHRLERVIRVGFGGFGLGVLALVVTAGFIGSENPTRDIAPTLVWVVWWVGLAFVSALLGDFWRLLNPWNAGFAGLEWLVARVRGRPPSPRLSPPRWLGSWPAVAGFLAFAWIEIVSSLGESPRDLAFLVIAYSAVTWAGMATFGRAVWLERGEVFHMAFGLFARFAPFTAADGQLRLRLPGAGLLEAGPVGLSRVAFVLAMLSTVTFDGLVETAAWAGLLDWLSGSEAARGPLLALRDAGLDLLVVIKTIAMALVFIAFVAIYLLFAGAMTALARAGGDGRARLGQAAGAFALSLVPIAIAYHLAHYYSFLLLAGQLILPLLSDPFGLGWNLFDTLHLRMDLSVVDAKTVWYLAVAAIVIGHVLAVYLAHVMAMRVYGGLRAALLSQLPMMVLMVLYTMSSLWVLSQPIVQT